DSATIFFYTLSLHDALPISFGEHHLVGEHSCLVELAGALGDFEPNDAVRLLLELHVHLLVGTRRIADVEPALLIEVGADRSIDRSEEHTSELQSLRHLVCRL